MTWSSLGRSRAHWIVWSALGAAMILPAIAWFQFMEWIPTVKLVPMEDAPGGSRFHWGNGYIPVLALLGAALVMLVVAVAGFLHLWGRGRDREGPVSGRGNGHGRPSSASE